MGTHVEVKAVGAMLALSVGYGVAGFTARELQKELGTWQQVALLNWLACIVALAMVWITQRRFFPAPISLKSKRELIVRALIGRALGSFLFIQACMHAPLGNVGWLTALPIGVVFAWALWGEHIQLRELLLLAVSVLGVACIVTPSLLTLKHIGFGEACAVLAAAASGFGSRLGKGSVEEAGVWSASVWLLFGTACAATVMANLVEGGLALPSYSRVPVFLFTLLLVVMNASTSLFGYAYLPASVSSAILTLEAVWAMAVGYMLYEETPTPLGVFGGVLVAGCAYAIQAKPRTCEVLTRRSPKCCK